ncbi:uncharacterized protein LOC128262095 [Drosophila gunungcola]|uniref:Uncharacterized protein n=1 Tax=Drosophila gunungcola TaxID=103775 RepID=A0A9P9YSQ3_9MUSC|nr:uncharacterized protein LOC128262095 [Drosophila gunungcola]KAI8042376.1 hypothetical protein M5D96_003688 [Drosophila gunungcola]
MWVPPDKKSTSFRRKAMDAVHRYSANPLPLWSRLLDHNAEGQPRRSSDSGSVVKEDSYEVEISNRLWSLWGTSQQVKPEETGTSLESLSGSASPSGKTLACCVLACCAGSFHSLDSWDSRLLDMILLNGQSYYEESLAARQRRDLVGALSLETLNTSCCLDGRHFWLDIEKFSSGKLYHKTKSLGAALSVFFARHLQTGILQLRDQALAFGFIPEFASGGAFFLFHCQAKGAPLFKDCESAPYVLRMRQLQQLLNCMLITLDERRHNVPFRIYKVGCVPSADCTILGQQN